MDKTLTLKLRDPNDEQREMINSNECIYAQWNEPAARPDPNRPCDTHGISGCERCFGWCDHGAPDPKDALTTARLEEALTLTRALVAERDQLRARVQELEARERELEQTIRLSDDEIRRLMSLAAERDAARAECQRLEAQAARMREALECIETGHNPSTGEPNASAAIAKQALAETDAGKLVQGLLEALRKCRDRIEADDCWRADNGEVQHNDLCVIATDALDAWNRCGRGRDGDGE